MFTLDDARTIALEVHAAQLDKIGRPYMLHVEEVAAGLADFDRELQIASKLHDVVENSFVEIGRVASIDELRQRGETELADSAPASALGFRTC